MYKFLARPLLFRFSSDYAHDLTVKSAKAVGKNSALLQALRTAYRYDNPALSQNIWGLQFKNPIGLAAGFDKNGTLAPAMESIGFGFLEIGSVTAEPSTGNPKPRSFRLPEDQSLINRMGLNNDGATTIARRIKKLQLDIPLGINIAKTHNPTIFGEKALQDYKTSFDLVKDLADYLTINISCPNTKEGKTFEEPDTLNELLQILNISGDSALPPVLIKFSVDIEANQLKELISICENHAVSGYVATNTSSKRLNLKSPITQINDIGSGGLSGQAISNRSTEIIEQISDLTHRDKTIIGVGGISSGQQAIDKIKAGADLLQVYTGLVYEGPSLVKKINKEIVNYLKRKGMDHIYDIQRSKSE